jgi:hypothetical protein
VRGGVRGLTYHHEKACTHRRVALLGGHFVKGVEGLRFQHLLNYGHVLVRCTP